ncbi:flavin monoamine oxidase family protein [Paenibacillus agri]|uniref:flavin monoamine oxidase family protein n=1 Tax=Paenibacillus agri TaxID=2744309 RepID=UPI0028AD77C9|nr:FAD-dependent oxidoreductase [Paenibacillus agri]
MKVEIEEKSNDPVVIVGAGLSGLRAASLLISQGIPCVVLESRERFGGRVLSLEAPDKPELGKFDLGPTWFWPQYEPMIASLVQELDLEVFAQHTEGAMLSERYKNEPAQRFMLAEGTVERSMRLTGGVRCLIDAVAATLPPGTIQLNTRVTSIRAGEDQTITLGADFPDGTQKSIAASAVILALPPRLVARHITFSPALPSELMASLMDKPTWMAGQAKVVAVYDTPFWRQDGLSGLVSSWVGPLQEIHDASPATGSGALFGFFGMRAEMRRELGEDKVLSLVVEQLSRLLGPSAEAMSGLLYKDWSMDPETAVEEDSTPLADFPNYGRLSGAGAWSKKIFFAGTETSPEHGGHLEGALQSAEQVVSEVIQLYQTHV